jgi:hypothetical protein
VQKTPLADDPGYGEAFFCSALQALESGFLAQGDGCYVLIVLNCTSYVN